MVFLNPFFSRSDEDLVVFKNPKFARDVKRMHASKIQDLISGCLKSYNHTYWEDMEKFSMSLNGQTLQGFVEVFGVPKSFIKASIILNFLISKYLACPEKLFFLYFGYLRFTRICIGSGRKDY